VKFSLAVFAADYWNHACTIIRLVSPAEQAGIQLIQGTEWTDQGFQVYPERLDQADGVVITRDFSRWANEYEHVIEKARSQNKFIVYEIDDLLLEIPLEHPDYDHYSAIRCSILRAIAEADAVIGSTTPICDYLRSYNPEVYLWPNYLDGQLWRIAGNRPSSVENRRSQALVPTAEAQGNVTKRCSRVRIGYMGGHSHAYDLDLIIPTLEKLLNHYDDRLEMIFWGIKPPETLHRLPNVNWVPVALANYREFADYFSRQNCEIFLAPLHDNLFNRCKSNLKFLEYSAIGAAGVYSRLAPYENVVVQGVNGFLASNSQEWETNLTVLIEDSGLRARIAKNAQATVANNWLLSEHAEEWKQLYQGLVKRPRLKKQLTETNFGRNIAEKMCSFNQTLEKEMATVKPIRDQLDQLRRELIEKDHLILHLNQSVQSHAAMYQQVVHSRSWRIMECLIQLRMRLMPRGSWLDRWTRAIVRSLLALKNQGVQGVFRQARIELRMLTAASKGMNEASIPSIRSTRLTSPIPPGARCPSPAISVLIIQNEGMDEFFLERVLQWIQSQTIRSEVNWIVWNKPSIINLSDVLQDCETKYICLASEDLLSQNETYLEVNLMALESESLAFTVNLRGDCTWTRQYLKTGRLPGRKDQPLYRLVVHKICVRDDLSLNLTAWQTESTEFLAPADQTQLDIRPGANYEPQIVAGKVLIHSTKWADHENSLWFENAIPANLTLLDRHFLFDHHPPLGEEGLLKIVLPVNEVIRAKSEPSDLPTVFIIMPFLAVGGAEKVTLKVIENLVNGYSTLTQIRFIILTFEPLNPELGTTADQFRQLSPYVYLLPDFLDDQLNGSFMEYLIDRFDPKTIYIANGTSWIYEALGEIKHRHPEIRIVNQVYDHQVGWINRYDPSLLLYLDSHIGINPRICQAYIDKGVRPEQVFFIENGTDPDEFNPDEYDQTRIINLKIQLGLPTDTRVVTFASRLNPQKRPLDFIEMARRFSSDPTITFLMVGDGPLAQVVAAQVHKIGLRNLYQKPFYQPINDILAISDVLVLPSEFEGMPMIIIETLSMGKPVVATDVGNVRDIIERTGGGVVIPQIGDIPGLMAGVSRMLKTPPDPTELRLATLSHFDWKICAQKLIPAFFGKQDA